ncbi:MAG: hypothetical protein IPG68_10665 [Micrococcales bacterium]|nr:hypothetical protein [Micrococcales bacterium]
MSPCRGTSRDWMAFLAAAGSSAQKDNEVNLLRPAGGQLGAEWQVHVDLARHGDEQVILLLDLDDPGCWSRESMC